MKKSIPIFISVLLLLWSCEKSGFKQEMVIGKWKVFGSGGGFSGQGATINFDYMNLEVTNDYSFIRNDSVIENGKYEIIQSNYDIGPMSDRYAIDFLPKNRLREGAGQITYRDQAFQISSSDTLTLYDGLIDGFIFYFKRK